MLLNCVFMWYNKIMKKEVFDILIIGGGVAGITASIYAKRRNKKVAIIEPFLLGGQLAQIEKIENFPTYPLISGFELMQNFQKQVQNLGIKVISDEITDVKFTKLKELVGKKQTYYAKSVIIATGLSSNKLGKNEDEFLGRGVSYCVTCDANFYKNQVVAVASRKGSGILGALELSDICEKVYLLDSEDINKYAENCPKKNIEVCSNVHIEKLVGENKLEKIELENADFLAVSALFIELGKKPQTEMFKDILELDNQGYILTNDRMETSVKGVFACGDIRSNSLKQLVVACGEGAIAGQYA